MFAFTSIDNAKFELILTDSKIVGLVQFLKKFKKMELWHWSGHNEKAV
jgi:hypothetical protein